RLQNSRLPSKPNLTQPSCWRASKSRQPSSGAHGGGVKSSSTVLTIRSLRFVSLGRARHARRVLGTPRMLQSTELRYNVRFGSEGDMAILIPTGDITGC